MSLKYSDTVYAHERLAGTLVRHNDTPVLVVEIISNGRALVQPAGGGKMYEVMDYKELDLTPVPLGNINTPEGEVSYIFRIPKRNDWRQGLRTNNMGALGRKTGHNNGLVARLIRGIYPTVMDCIESIFNEEASDRAFGRNFSIRKGRNDDYVLVFRNKKEVGTLKPNKAGGVTYELSKKFEFMEEMLKEELH